METKTVRQKGKRSVGAWIAAGVAALAISAVGSYQPSVFESIKIKGSHFMGDKTSETPILMADGNNNPKPGGG